MSPNNKTAPVALEIIGALELLLRRVESVGQAAAARELGLSRAAVSQYLSGKYKADTGRIESRIINIYSAGDKLTCPHRGEEITPAECAAQYDRAAAVGLRATGNPETLRQHHACLHCPKRS